MGRVEESVPRWGPIELEIIWQKAGCRSSLTEAFLFFGPVETKTKREISTVLEINSVARKLDNFITWALLERYKEGQSKSRTLNEPNFRGKLDHLIREV